MGDNPQPIEEVAAHFAEGGPVDAALRFIEVVDAGDMANIWPLVDADFRLALAQDWVLANAEMPPVAVFDRDELAQDLASDRPTHMLWPDFAGFKLADFAGSVEGIEGYGIASHPRTPVPGYEFVVFIRNDGSEEEVRLFTEPTPVMARVFLMRSTDGGWRVASLSNELWSPGWPPRAQELVV